jgi:hypothetical protein
MNQVKVLELKHTFLIWNTCDYYLTDFFIYDLVQINTKGVHGCNLKKLIWHDHSGISKQINITIDSSHQEGCRRLDEEHWRGDEFLFLKGNQSDLPDVWYVYVHIVSA